MPGDEEVVCLRQVGAINWQAIYVADAHMFVEER